MSIDSKHTFIPGFSSLHGEILTEKNYDELAVKYAKKYRGRIEVIPRCPIHSLEDFAIWYTPGVAENCRRILEDKNESFEQTWRWNTVAVVTDGSRVLGLGNIGAVAGLPVMEGKALLFKYLGGVDAIPLAIATQEPDEIIRFVKNIEPSFGGVNLEDIATPKCFYILSKLQEELDIPVWHDDQQGTATVTLTALINALKIVGKKMKDISIAMIGAGAANIAIAKLLMKAGVDRGKIVMVDSKGILNKERSDMEHLKISNPYKWEIAHLTNRENRRGGIAEALEGVDVVIAASRPGPGVIKKEWMAKMADDAIVFALANPVPEIWPWEAKEAGARVVATGRSDYPNQVNNSLVFPAVFRGALDVRAKKITDEMIIAAAQELASYAEEKGLREDYIVPTMEDWDVYPRVAAIVAEKAVEQDLARRKLSREEEEENARKIIERTRSMVKLLMDKEFIEPLD